MAESLNRAWRDLLGILTQRGRLLDLAMECFNSADNVIQQAERVEHLCITGSWGHDISSVRRLIEVSSCIITILASLVRSSIVVYDNIGGNDHTYFNTVL